METKDSNFPYLEKLSEDLYYVTTSTTAPRMHYRAAVRVEQNQTGGGGGTLAQGVTATTQSSVKE
ncbi:hypothetical protein DEO72_LG10g2321 [Vigna unguiculata]|uniref:Uncharacterized protein n=1 Tax=Vigna unguiculata TaxID=3917 RepID=A0A4D6NCQ4_VIGUN|nr:hypothetical protein DEO72_LG10g2321 [Vigna unguiculata]